MVTLEPLLPKDAFLQGCARMRNLREGGQSLVLAGTSEVVDKDTSVESVLTMVLQNTVHMVRKGAVTFFEHGIDYSHFPEPKDELLDLESMYANPREAYNDFSSFLDASASTHESNALTSRLVDYCKDLGRGIQIDASKLSAECEQEVEREVEREEETEVELPEQKPQAEEDWPFEQAFSHPGILFSRNRCVNLKSVVQDHLSRLSDVVWSEDLFCTRNFWKTFQQAASSKDISMYLRTVNYMLILDDKRVVLVSEYEANKLLPLWWVASSGNPKAVLHQLPLVIRQTGFGSESATKIPVNVRTSVKLFRGYVNFDEQEEDVLKDMFRAAPSRQDVIRELLMYRGRIRFFERSSLDDFSTRLDAS